MAITIILIAFLLFLMKVLKIKIMEPAGLYCVVWNVFIIGSILSLESDYEFKYGGIIWILITCYIFVIISKLISVNKKEDSNEVVKKYPVIPWKLLLFFVFMGMGSVAYTMFVSGINVSVFSDFSTLQNVAHTSAVNRYSNGSSEGTLVSQILGSFVYIAPISAGYSYIYAQEKKQKVICISSVIPALLSMLLTSAKLSLIAFVILFFVGYYISFIYSKNNVPHIKMKTLFAVGIGAIGLYLLFFLSFVLRIGNGEGNLSKIIREKLMIYAFGHIQGFDVWFSRYAFKIQRYGLGKNTFLAISSKLGIAEKNQGVYGLIENVCTNVYTPFRGLVEDYGVIFSTIILTILFIIIYIMYKKILVSKKKNIFVQTLFTANIFWLIYFIISAWTYTTYVLTFVVFSVYLYISFNIRFVWRKNK